jgi:LPXTG-motif cell wall-anchored protein
MTATILSILMLAGIALLAGGIYLIAKKRDMKRGLLMIVAAIVMFGNVAIMSMPVVEPVH